MGFELIRLGGGALRHILGAFLLAWRRAARAAGIALVVGIVVTEVAGSLTTRHFPPYLLTHVVALAIGIVVAYCVGMMMLVDELLKGVLDLVRMALGEAEAGARTAAIIAEREVGDVWGWVRRLAAGRDAEAGPPATRPRLAPTRSPSGHKPLGAPRSPAGTLGQFPMPQAAATGGPAPATRGRTDPGRLRVPPQIGTMRPSPSPAAPARDETRDDVAATDAFRKTAPPSPANAHPVRADQLPRIGWAMEGLAAGAALLESALAARAGHAHLTPPADHPPTQTETALETMPPLPRRNPAATPGTPPTSNTPPSAPTPGFALPATAAAASGPQPAQPPVPLAAEPAMAPPTVPLEPAAAEPVAAPRPSARASSPVRTVPVVTDEATRAALETIGEEPQTREAAGAAPAVHEVRSDATDHDTRTDASAAVAPNEEASDEEALDAPWEPPNRAVVLPAAEDQTRRATREARGNGGVWPDEEDESPGAEERGLWSRIGQALVRSTTRPLRERGDDDASPNQRD